MANLSRKYRPKTFADITDQAGVKQTLCLEVESNKIGHAYLFGGPRGVGKTTAARIFAKALNCERSEKGEPCNVCASCVSADSGSNLGIIEMDAASNNGIDTVRENIIEHVRFSPSGTKRKVYILDEAHMITTAAWNALLKTLEEPPEYAVFILITTEIHKVPATIQSRCQRFNFKRIPDELLFERIRFLAMQENCEIDDQVIKRIVSKSDGCVRDAESLLGQLMVFGEKKITDDIADLILPVSHLPMAAKLLQICATRQLGNALQCIAEFEEQGIPLVPLFDDIILAIRQLLLAADSVSHRQKLANGDEADRSLASMVTTYEASELADMALLFMERRRDAKQGADERFCMELAASAIVLGLLPSQKSITPSIPDIPPTQPHTSPVQTPTIRLAHSAPSELNSNTPITSASDSSPVSIGFVQVKWQTFLKTVDEKSPSLTFILRISRPLRIEGNTVFIQFQYPYHREKIIGTLKTKQLIEDCLRSALDCPNVRVDGEVAIQDEEGKQIREQDTVNTLLRAFGGQVVEEGGTA
ncbi:DNA polymerase III subunit gamma/tau [Candidatus Uhrbacteria bacterium]|nr:DNA polymerase III subunit gamma/tau [Candidatus Uhrbacteria bacterium]